ncbi:hypothetical protein FA95DRAFT_1557319, partial [Auriscalpium vulgare]
RPLKTLPSSTLCAELTRPQSPFSMRRQNQTALFCCIIAGNVCGDVWTQTTGSGPFQTHPPAATRARWLYSPRIAPIPASTSFPCTAL